MTARPTIPPRTRGGRAGYVALLAGQPAAAPAVAAALNVDAYHARQLMLRPVPAVIAFADADEARAAAAAVAAAGVRCVAFTQADLDAVPDARPVARLTVRGAEPDAGPYRTAEAAEIEVVTVPGAPALLALAELALAVVGRLATQRIEEVEKEVVIPRGGGTTERKLRRERVRERGGRAVIDLHVHRGAPLRLVEGATTVRGLGLRDFEHTAAFLRLRRWLERPGRGVAIDDGWVHEAPRHEELARTGRGELRDTSGGWDEWSARAVVIWRLARR